MILTTNNVSSELNCKNEKCLKNDKRQLVYFLLVQLEFKKVPFSVSNLQIQIVKVKIGLPYVSKALDVIILKEIL